jgi:hypothetical protein
MPLRSENLKKAQLNHYNKLKADPVKYADYLLKKKQASDKRKQKKIDTNKELTENNDMLSSDIISQNVIISKNETIKQELIKAKNIIENALKMF